MGLFDDFWDVKLVADSTRRVGQGFIGRKARSGDILAHDIEDRNGVGGRLDIRNIDFLKLRDVIDDLLELIVEACGFLRTQFEAGKVRGAGNVDIRHGLGGVRMEGKQ
jgi:hypothetical protein